MTTIPDLIVNYNNYKYNCDKLSYYTPINKNTLIYLCLIKLLEVYPPLKLNLTIEELIDVHAVGCIVLSYPLVNRITRLLNIFHIKELFDPLVEIFNNQLKDLVFYYLSVLESLKIIFNCYFCNKVLLMPSDYYYYTCEYCNCNQYQKSQDNYFDNHLCEQCQNPVSYYLITDQFKFKLVVTSYQALYYHQGKKFSFYDNRCWCAQACGVFPDLDQFTVKCYHKYNQLYNN